MLYLPDDVDEYSLFNDRTLLEMIPDEETLIKAEDLKLIGTDTQGFPE